MDKLLTFIDDSGNSALLSALAETASLSFFSHVTPLSVSSLQQAATQLRCPDLLTAGSDAKLHFAHNREVIKPAAASEKSIREVLEEAHYVRSGSKNVSAAAAAEKVIDDE